MELMEFGKLDGDFRYLIKMSVELVVEENVMKLNQVEGLT